MGPHDPLCSFSVPEELRYCSNPDNHALLIVSRCVVNRKTGPSTGESRKSDLLSPVTSQYTSREKSATSVINSLAFSIRRFKRERKCGGGLLLGKSICQNVRLLNFSKLSLDFNSKIASVKMKLVSIFETNFIFAAHT